MLNFFDVINTLTGVWIYFYKKRGEQKIIQTFHGTVYYFNKNHFGRLNPIGKILIFPLLVISWLVGLPSKKNTDRIICVSEKVKQQVKKLYGKKENIVIIRTGVDLKDFKIRNKNNIKEKLSLNKKDIHGLYVGRGGYWTKGLDRAIELSEEIHKLNKNYKLIIVGADYKKVKHLINKKFVIYLKEVEREKMPFYYNVADIFFCMSRYEGGAPTLVVSEAMASGCLIVCSKSSEQEIIENGKNGLILENFDEKDAKKIMNVLKNKRKSNRIIKNSIKTIKEISLEKWGEKYFNSLID